ncbi:hypothetical protein HanRHA438_Chr10g0480001 [Helianthus annuus]|nr:hypothetical protein HanRHA438_Chr10g0480001 [Helianthus annuus]
MEASLTSVSVRRRRRPIPPPPPPPGLQRQDMDVQDDPNGGPSFVCLFVNGMYIWH